MILPFQRHYNLYVLFFNYILGKVGRAKIVAVQFLVKNSRDNRSTVRPSKVPNRSSENTGVRASQLYVLG